VRGKRTWLGEELEVGGGQGYQGRIEGHLHEVQQPAPATDHRGLGEQ
jgi:hypothetical protein